MEERFIRQIALKEVGEEGQRKLKSSKVLLVGAGGLASSAGLYLAAAGVGEIGICDGDSVEVCNLHRQIIHAEKNAGMGKARSAAEGMKRVNSDIKVEVYPFLLDAENALEIILKYDFVLDCTDAFGSKFLINDACVIAKKPYCHAGVVRFSGQVMTYVPGKGPCLRCYLESVPKKGSYPLCRDVGVLGSVVGLFGCIEATECLKYLLGIGELLTGRILKFDGLTMTSQVISIPHQNPDCPICGRAGATLAEHREEYIS